MTIEVANSLIVGQTNTPLDARTRIATLADVSTVANPFVGMRVYVLDEAKSYIVKSLKDKLIGAYTVPDAQIDTVEPLSAELNLPMLFALPSKLEGDPALHFTIEFHETDDYSETSVYSIDTAVSQTGVKVLDGTAWVAFPAGGAGTIFYGNQIKVEYNEAMGGVPKNVRYKLYLKDDDPTAQPWKYTAYPAVGGADGGGGVDGADGVDGNINAIVSATPPENPGNGTIWIEA